jgi:hypothetical protein
MIAENTDRQEGKQNSSGTSVAECQKCKERTASLKGKVLEPEIRSMPLFGFDEPWYCPVCARVEQEEKEKMERASKPSGALKSVALF